MSILRGAARLMSGWLVLQELGLALAVFLLFALWLRIPDASALEFGFSILLALIVLATAGLGQAWIILKLVPRPRTPALLFRGAILTLGAVAVWLLWSAGLDHAHAGDPLRAGYWNSRFPHGMRPTFSYQHILLWLDWFWSALSWVGAGILAVVVFDLTASLNPARALARSVRSISYWLVLLIGVPAAIVVSSTLAGWTPGHGLKTELLSLATRIVAAAVFDAAVAGYLLSLLTELVRVSDSERATSGNAPDDSQPRTAVSP